MSIVVLAVVAFLVYSLTRSDRNNVATMEIGRVAQLAREGKVTSITVSEQDLTVETTDGKTYKSRKEERGSVVETLQNLGVPSSAIGAGQGQIAITVKTPSRFGPTCCRS